MTLKDKVAVITGGNSGIGAASARKLAEAGSRVGILGRSSDKVEASAKELEADGYESLPLVADISQSDELKAAFNKVMEHWGQLDILFANAGINGTWAPLDEISEDEWDQTLDINLKGTFLTVKHALPHLKQRGGSIIVTSSVNGTRVFSNTGATAYACSKAAQVAFVKMTALELAPYRIRINAICPGSIESQIDDNTTKEQLDNIRLPVNYPQGKIPLTGEQPGAAEDVAETVVFLASDRSKHITGTELWIDGGQSLLMG